MARFAENYEEMLESQKFDIINVFLNLPSPYTVRPELCYLKMDFVYYSQLNQEEKGDLKKKILNPLVDETRSKEVMSFRPGYQEQEKTCRVDCMELTPQLIYHKVV